MYRYFNNIGGLSSSQHNSTLSGATSSGRQSVATPAYVGAVPGPAVGQNPYTSTWVSPEVPPTPLYTTDFDKRQEQPIDFDKLTKFHTPDGYSEEEEHIEALIAEEAFITEEEAFIAQEAFTEEEAFIAEEEALIAGEAVGYHELSPEEEEEYDAFIAEAAASAEAQQVVGEQLGESTQLPSV